MSEQKPTPNRSATNDPVEMQVIEIARDAPGTEQLGAVYLDHLLWKNFFPPMAADMFDLLAQLLVLRLLEDAMKAAPTIPANLDRMMCRSFSHRFLNGIEDVAALAAFAAQCEDMAVSAAISLGCGGDLEVENYLSQSFYGSMERELELGILVDLDLMIHPQVNSKPFAIICVAGHPFRHPHGFH